MRQNFKIDQAYKRQAFVAIKPRLRPDFQELNLRLESPIFGVKPETRVSFEQLAKNQEINKLEEFKVIFIKEEMKIKNNYNIMLIEQNELNIILKNCINELKKKNKNLEKYIIGTNYTNKLKELEMYRLKDRKNKIRFCPYI